MSEQVRRWREQAGGSRHINIHQLLAHPLIRPSFCPSFLFARRAAGDEKKKGEKRSKENETSIKLKYALLHPLLSFYSRIITIRTSRVRNLESPGAAHARYSLVFSGCVAGHIWVWSGLHWKSAGTGRILLLASAAREVLE